MEKNNLAIALGVLCAKEEKIYPGYVSMCSSNHEIFFFLNLMIPKGLG